MAIFEGDIILAATPKEIERLGHKKVKGIGIKGEQFRWPRGEIPYTIECTLPNQDRVIQAIQHWEGNTRIRFIQRIDTNAKYYPNYVTFRRPP
jgi:astacin